MFDFLKALFFIIFINQAVCIPICEERKNNCYKCDYISQLCIKCSKGIYTPDKNGVVREQKNVLLVEIIAKNVKKIQYYVKYVKKDIFQMKMGDVLIQIIVKYLKEESVLNAKMTIF